MRITKTVLLVSLVALVVVPTALALRFTDDSYNPPVGNTGQTYSWSFTGAGGCGPALPYQYRVLSGNLPPGLTLDQSGLVHGNPAQAGEYSFWIELSDENPPSASWCRPSSAQREFTIKINQGLSIQQTVLNPKITFLNEAYSFQLTATGAGTWSIQSGNLPTGVTLSSAGLLSGTPTVAGDFSFVVKVTNGSATATKTFALTVVQRLKITPPSEPAAEVGAPFKLALQATGGKAPYKWSLTGGTLPSGFTLDPATGAISGVPGVAGSGAVKLTVTDALGLTDTLDLSIPVAAKLAITKKLLRAAKAGVKYKAHFLATGGVTPKTWKIVGGKLPTGLRLNSKTGELTGIARKAGSFRFSVGVTDNLGAVSKAAFVLKVNA